jgi:hypothetical protein
MSFEVEMGGWCSHSPKGYPEDVTITGLGPCVGVIIYDVASKISFACHLTSPHEHESECFQAMLTQAAKDLIHSEQVHICVSGSCDSRSPPSKDTLAKREYVANALKLTFPSHSSDVRWPAPGTKCVSMILDPETGKFYLD